MKGLSHVAMGQFYEGIKAQTKVMLNAPLLGQKASSEYLKVKYLRGLISLHAHMNTLIIIIHTFQCGFIVPPFVEPPVLLKQWCEDTSDITFDLK